MRIGIFGGTFNPIHNMHIVIAEKARDQLKLDKLIFITSADPPHKYDNGIVSASLRHEMVKLAIAERPYFEASDMEITRQGKSYTFYTLTALKQKHPDDELFFIVGGDSLAYLHKWYRADEFMSLCTFAVFPRNGDSGETLTMECDWLKSNYGTKTVILDAVPVDVSSTDVRQRLCDGIYENIDVPEAVLQYIKEHNLYNE